MKLATLKDRTRDGRLVVVSRDLTRYTDVGHIARSLQQALDDWEHVAPRLVRVAEGLETGTQPVLRFHEHDAASPLPRAYQWISGTPELTQRGSGNFTGPRDPIPAALQPAGIDFGAEVAVIVDDVPMGTGATEAREKIRLVLLANGVTLRDLPMDDGPVPMGRSLQANPSAAFSPVAVTPDELGDAWQGGKLCLPLLVGLDGRPPSRENADADRWADFGQLIAGAARTRRLTAGTIISSGQGAAMKGTDTTPVLSTGQSVRIEMKDHSGHSIFGAIEQQVDTRSLSDSQ